MKTIHMKEADWQKWDTALRSGEYKQSPEALHSISDGGYCCLGVLQMALDGHTARDGDDELPSLEWLADHGIEFDTVSGTECTDARAPSLPLCDTYISAATANDMTEYDAGDGSDVHVYDFIKIADAIKDAVEFTDA